MCKKPDRTALTNTSREPLIDIVEGDDVSIVVGVSDEYLQTCDKGLSSEEVVTRQSTFGPNALPEKKKSPILELLGHFWGPMPVRRRNKGGGAAVAVAGGAF